MYRFLPIWGITFSIKHGIKESVQAWKPFQFKRPMSRYYPSYKSRSQRVPSISVKRKKTPVVEDNIDFLRKWEMMTSYTQLKGQTGGRRAKWKKHTWITGNYVIWYFSPKLNINKPLSTSSSSYQKVLWASCPGHVDRAQTCTAADYYCGSDTELALGKTHQTGCSMVKEPCVQTPLEICLVKPKPSVF